MSKSGLTFSLAGFGKDGGYWICLRKGILRKLEGRLMAGADAIVTYLLGDVQCRVLDIRYGGWWCRDQASIQGRRHLPHLPFHSCGKDLSILASTDMGFGLMIDLRWWQNERRQHSHNTASMRCTDIVLGLQFYSCTAKRA